jgi:hypothetical protein
MWFPGGLSNMKPVKEFVIGSRRGLTTMQIRGKPESLPAKEKVYPLVGMVF